MEHEYENIHLKCTPVVVQVTGPVLHDGIMAQFVPSKVAGAIGVRGEGGLFGSAGGGLSYWSWLGASMMVRAVIICDKSIVPGLGERQRISIVKPCQGQWQW